jgi:ketosteroid isomerase-like protein
MDPGFFVRKNRMKLLILLLIAGPILSLGQPIVSHQNLSKDQLEVLNTIKAWNDAFAKNDPSTYFQFIHEDITLFLPSCPFRIDGKQDDREEFEYSLKKGWTRVGYFQELQPKIEVTGNTAIVTYHNRGTYGNGVAEKNRLSEGNRRIDKRKWTMEDYSHTRISS